jgi:hypothetical protein
MAKNIDSPTTDKGIKKHCILGKDEKLKRFPFPGHPGLYLECRLSDDENDEKLFRTWRYQYRRGGKVETFTIGRYDVTGSSVQIGIEKAKEEYLKARELVREGTNPTVQKRERLNQRIEQEGQTVSLIGNEWLNVRRVADSASTFCNRKYRFTAFIEPLLGKKSVRDVVEDDIKSVIRRVFKHYWEQNQGKDTTRPSAMPALTLMDLNQMFNYVIGDLEIRVKNPCLALMGRGGFVASLNAGDTRIKEKVVEHINKPALHQIKQIPELADLLRAINKPIDDFRNGESGKPGSYLLANIAMMALAHIACRPVEILYMRANQIEGQVWHAIIQKTSKKATIALSESACILIELAKTLNNAKGSDFVFRSIDGQKPIKDDYLFNLLPKLGYKGKHSPHAWRITFRTLGSELFRFPKDDMERQLTHGQRGNKTEAAYDKAEMIDYRIGMMQAWSEFIDMLLVKGSKIVPGELQARYRRIIDGRISSSKGQEIVV